MYFRGADGLMLVFDVTSEESFENIRNWVRDINKHVEKASVQKILVANKADLSSGDARGTVRLHDSRKSTPVATTTTPEELLRSHAVLVIALRLHRLVVQGARVVSEERARALASEFGLPYIETSAKDNHNVNEAFMQLASSIKQITDEAAAAAAAATGDSTTAPGSDGGEVHPLVLTSKPADSSSSGGCC